MKEYTRGIGLAGLTLLVTLAISGPVAAETNAEWCKNNGGTWKGVTNPGLGDTNGICTFTIIARDRGSLECTNVGGIVSKNGASQSCSVSSVNFPKVKASSEFRAVIGGRNRGR